MRCRGAAKKAWCRRVCGRLWLSLALVVATLCGFGGVACGAQGAAVPLLPTSVAYDAVGNLYFADANRHEVYESSLGGVLTVVAGDGVQGFAGDGGAATAAELNSPQGVAVGADGTLYIADTGNARIRAVRGGVITTFAGTGASGFSGDGGAALLATFRRPEALAVDGSGALLVCDTDNERVRRISGGMIATVAGDGVQGFAGDGGLATAAEMDTPMGVAVGADGRVFVADSHNARIRVVGTNGVMTTFAGSGVHGFSGDGGAATAAELSMPTGVAVTPGGGVIFADSNNQRIRMVTAAGVIETIVGTGMQGTVPDGTAATAAEVNAPRGVGVSGFGSAVYADALNGLVRERVANGKVYSAGGIGNGSSSVALTASQGTGGLVSAVATITGPTGAAQGAVELLDGTSVVGQATVSGGVATFPPVTMAAGEHSLTAMYMGDGVDPAAVSAAWRVSVGSAVVTVTAVGASMAYGGQMPALTGSLSGVQPADVGKVEAVFTSTAGALSPVGSYPIVATLTGPAAGRYSVAMSPASGELRIVQAASTTVEQPLAQGSYAGLPLMLTAQVMAAGAGTPTGSVQFMDGGTVVATAAVMDGVASGMYLSPPAGPVSLTARYGGDGNFVGSSSAAMTTTVAVVPDFTLATTGSTTQTIGLGGVGTFGLVIGAAASGAFTGAVDLSASGLPTGATVSFSPPQVVPGTGSAAVTMSVQTSSTLTTLTMVKRYGGMVVVAMLLPLFFVRRNRRGALQMLAASGLLTMLIGVVGCGARTASTTALGAQTYALTVKGTATNLAGVVVSHSTQVTLVVE